MVTDAKRTEILKNLSDGVVEYKEDQVKEYASIAVREGLDPYDAIMNGLAVGMEIVIDLYDRHEYFLPEILMCADALCAGLGILKRNLNRESASENRGQLVIGKVHGLHDFGKKLVKMMLGKSGFTVNDLALICLWKKLYTNNCLSTRKL
jgi:methanogenic corrinoid protein MtbC1